MSVFKFVIIGFCFQVCSAWAGTYDCEPSSSQPDWTSMHTNLELKPANVNITLGSDLADWQVIYEMDNVVFGRLYANCNSWNDSQFTLLSAGAEVKETDSDVIYKTDVPGIGISVRSSNGHALKVFPETAYGYDSPSQGSSYIINIKYWKISGEKIPLNNGAISVTGPEVAGLIGVGSYDSVTSSQIDRIITSQYSYYINNSRILHGTLIFQVGTCNVEGDNINVDMGDYDGSNGHSSWKDASFKLVCPDAYGYGGSADAQSNTNYPYQLSPGAKITANNKQNGRVQISIVPYTETLDANRGIIGLDGTGAQGYGIQLAWGDYSIQNLAEPTNPVILNSYVDAHSLNAAFSGGDTPIGGNGLVGLDNTIKMAARYIRTSGDTAPGPANAVVQVIANYQ
ncbi:TPA: hypothetical protein JD045_22435 [Citrobacter amalonaticus]|nr:hypothetical protein [Citrobacter amalonaticus]